MFYQRRSDRYLLKEFDFAQLPPIQWSPRKEKIIRANQEYYQGKIQTSIIPKSASQRQRVLLKLTQGKLFGGDEEQVSDSKSHYFKSPYRKAVVGRQRTSDKSLSMTKQSSPAKVVRTFFSRSITEHPDTDQPQQRTNNYMAKNVQQWQSQSQTELKPQKYEHIINKHLSSKGNSQLAPVCETREETGGESNVSSSRMISISQRQNFSNISLTPREHYHQKTQTSHFWGKVEMRRPRAN